MKQRSFADLQLEQYRKPSRISLKLEKIDALVDWQAIFELVKVVDKTQQGVGGASHKDLLSKVKILFLGSSEKCAVRVKHVTQLFAEMCIFRVSFTVPV